MSDPLMRALGRLRRDGARAHRLDEVERRRAGLADDNPDEDGRTTFPNELVEPAQQKRPEWIDLVVKQDEAPGPYPVDGERRHRRR